ncbi:hypothetical protein [Pseudofrankia sp. BMG5.36]|uniref:hypothetical protein n=1 Tax=Pseudofrankia sp. BMG5.36 TaxID=1834512 RepID=UPI0008D930EF|nr:hypothetical protein [Pseudofrankia sp. BMG5.36]OHV64166.1 hypothetical protein BCD48_37575 [Pseudofrankia sp. BMG5.36]
MSSPPVYRLPPRRVGTALYGLTVSQLTLTAAGLTSLILATVLIRGQAGLLTGTAALVVAVLLATVRLGGEPLHDLLPLLLRFTVAAPRCRVAARRTATAEGGLPGWLPGLDLLTVETPALATVDGAPTAVLRHRRSGALTVVLDIRGGPFTLAEPADQHRRLAAWAGVLAQTARDPAVLTLGFTVHTHHTHADLPPTPDLADGRARPSPRRTDHTIGTRTAAMVGLARSGGTGAAGAAVAWASYRRLLADTLLQQHDLRLWLTIDPHHHHDTHRADRTRRRGARPELAAVNAAVALAARARAAGLTVHGALSPGRLVADILTQLDPDTPDSDATAERDDPQPPVVAPRRHLTVVTDHEAPQATALPPALAATGTAPSVGLAARAGLPGALTAPSHPRTPAGTPAPAARPITVHATARRRRSTPGAATEATLAMVPIRQTEQTPVNPTDPEPVSDPRRRRATRDSQRPSPLAPPRRTHQPTSGPARPAAELAAYWDAVRVGATWHRVFRVATWPTGPLHPGWLDPLLHESPPGRTLTTALTPIPPAASRRRLNHDTAALDLAIQIRDRHAVRIPTHLAHAREQIDQRDAELSAGHPELAYLTLIDLAAPDRLALDAASAQLVDLAARAGITDLRPLHGRHHPALTATLPLGLTPRRPHPGAT